MELSKKLVGVCITSIFLAIVFAGLLTDAVLCINNTEKSDIQRAACYVASVLYSIPLAFCVAVFFGSAIYSYYLNYRELVNRESKPTEVARYDALLPPEEEESAVQLQGLAGQSNTEDAQASRGSTADAHQPRRGSTGGAQAKESPYKSFPVAAIYAHS